MSQDTNRSLDIKTDKDDDPLQGLLNEGSHILVLHYSFPNEFPGKILRAYTNFARARKDIELVAEENEHSSKIYNLTIVPIVK